MLSCRFYFGAEELCEMIRTPHCSWERDRVKQNEKGDHYELVTLSGLNCLNLYCAGGAAAFFLWWTGGAVLA
jgi:hypothetical protein